MKFRRALEPAIAPPSSTTITASNVLRAPGNLLIGFSGGMCSSVLLDLVHRSYMSDAAPPGADGKQRNRGKNAPQRRKDVWQKVRVAYVEMCAAFPGVFTRSTLIRHSDLILIL